jgi:predicted tellurium resistance membrane protein TerC
MSWLKRPLIAWVTYYVLLAVLIVAVAIIIYGNQKQEGKIWPATYIVLFIGTMGLVAGVIRLILDLRNPEKRKRLLGFKNNPEGASEQLDRDN